MSTTPDDPLQQLTDIISVSSSRKSSKQSAKSSAKVPKGSTDGRRASTVSIAEREGGEEHPEAGADPLLPKPTPRGRRTTKDESSLPAPMDDIFKSSYWSSLPIGMSSLENQITNVKLDLIMGYIQDIRLTLSGDKPLSRVSSRSARSETSIGSSQARRESIPPEYEKFKIAPDDLDAVETLAKTATTIPVLTEPAIRLFVNDNPAASKHKNRTKNCIKTAADFLKFIGEIGEGLPATEQEHLGTYGEDDATNLFLNAVKERIRIYNRANPSSDSEDPEDIQTGPLQQKKQSGADTQDDAGDGNGDGSSEPVRSSKRTGEKSGSKGKSESAKKKQKASIGGRQAATTATSTETGGDDDQGDKSAATGSSTHAGNLNLATRVLGMGSLRRGSVRGRGGKSRGQGGNTDTVD